jgi:hypothetical protein
MPDLRESFKISGQPRNALDVIMYTTRMGGAQGE